VTIYRLVCQTMRREVRVRVQVPRRDGSWDTQGIELVPVRRWDRWRAELEAWAVERGVALEWAGKAIERARAA